MSSIQWRQYEQARLRKERIFLPKVYRALRHQFIEYANRIETGQDIMTLLPIEELGGVIRSLYLETGVSFARSQSRELQAEIKRFNPSDKWVNEINEYFRLSLFDKVVLPISETTRDIVLKIIQKGQEEGWGTDKIVSYIRKETKELSRWRAKMIVRTETGRAANLGKWKAAQDFKFETDKKWVSAGDRRVRPQPTFSPNDANHIILNRENAKLDGLFSNGLLFPGDPNGPANETINCRCTLVFVAVKDADGRPIPRRSTMLPNAALQQLLAV